MVKHPVKTIVKVALPVPLRKVFDYTVPANVAPSDLQAGTRVQVPFGKRTLIGIVQGVTQDSAIELTALKSIKEVLDDCPALTPEIMALCNWAAQYYHHPIGEVYSQAIPTLLRNQNIPMLAKSVRWQLTQKGRLLGLEQLNRAKKQQEALAFLREHPVGLHEPILKSFNITQAIIKALHEKGLIEPHEETTSHPQRQADNCLAETPLSLNPEQARAVNQINQTQTFQVLALEGITGSGKTEVYLHAIEHCLRRNRQALVLVPEIGLTPQTINHFKRRFNAPVVSLHSNLSDKERLDSWNRSRLGGAAVIIGTRSALFTATQNLGLIVVDEEHDLSYKQQEGFRFNARDLAIIRAQQENIPVVLGSATPSLETSQNAQLKRYQHLYLSQRAGQASTPKFRIQDIRQKALTHGLSPELLKEIKDCLRKEQQALVFINRRGFSPVLMCHDCGWLKECPHCEHRMTLHNSPPHLHCHHCNYQLRPPKHCAQCKSTDLRPIGMGTERLEENLSQLFPDTAVIRIDRDSTQRKYAMQQHLARINSGEPCILVGTQMLAKGHHFPKVTLVAICDLDSGLFSADFRATEHTAQLLMQVAGRAGRGSEQGVVFLQTHQPDHPMFQVLLQHSYHEFAKQLIIERKCLGMPPFGHIALLKSESITPSAAENFLHQVEKWLAATASALGVELWGPAPALMPKKAGRYRFQILFKAQTRRQLHQLLTPLVTHLDNQNERQVRWNLDIDPVTLD